MKKRLLLLCFLIIGTMNAFAQKTPVVFYGVDFSLVKVCGADESDTEFLFAFNKINDLFISEGQKYDVAKFMRLPITTKELAVAKRATKNAIPVSEDGNEHRLLYEDPNYDCLPQIETRSQATNFRRPKGAEPSSWPTCWTSGTAAGVSISSSSTSPRAKVEELHPGRRKTRRLRTPELLGQCALSGDESLLQIQITAGRDS